MYLQKLLLGINQANSGTPPVAKPEKKVPKVVIKPVPTFGLNPLAFDKQGRTAFHVAAYNGDCKWLQTLLAAHPAFVDVLDGFGRTALMYAAEKGHFETINFLKKHGADINALDAKDRTPLHSAVKAEHLPTIEALVKLGADINAQTLGCPSPLWTAIGVVAPPIVQLLIDNGADVNQRWGSMCPLHMVAWMYAGGEEELEVAQILIDSGANLYEKDSEQNLIPLEWAELAEHNRMVQLLSFASTKVSTKRITNKA